MGIRAHELSIAHIISNWFGQMHVHQRHDSVPSSSCLCVCIGGADGNCSQHTLPLRLKSLVLVIFVFTIVNAVDVVVCPKLCVLPTPGTEFIRLSCRITVRQAITIGEAKLTNNQNGIKSFKYLFDWIKKFCKYICWRLFGGCTEFLWRNSVDWFHGRLVRIRLFGNRSDMYWYLRRQLTAERVIDTRTGE